MTRNQTSLTALVASLLLNATNIFDLPLWATWSLRFIGLMLAAVLLSAAWRWHRSRDLTVT